MYASMAWNLVFDSTILYELSILAFGSAYSMFLLITFNDIC